MIREERQRLEAAFRAGFESALRAYAVWRDGEQRIGVMSRTLPEVLDEVEAGKHECYRTDLLIHFAKIKEAAQRAEKRRERCHDGMEPCPDCEGGSRA